MGEVLTHEQVMHFLSRTLDILKEDVLTEEDMSKVFGIYIDACQRKKAELDEACLKKQIENGTSGIDEAD